MKKSLIALAVLAASGVASAQSTVTLYGLVDMYVGSTKTTVSPVGLSSTSLRQSVVDSGGFNTSRFGLKGSEDLGGGLKANFVLESGFDASTGVSNQYTNPFTGVTSNSTFSRNSWVGLSGSFGEVKLGKMWTPYDEVKGSGAAGFDANIFAPAGGVWLSNSYSDRPGNSIYYSTPTVSGFSAAALYAFGENKTTTNKAGKIISFNVQYAGGPVAVALSHQEEKPGGGSPIPKVKFTQINGSYDFGVAKLLAAYGNVKNLGLVAPSFVAPVALIVADKAKEYQIGVEVPLSGALTLSGGYARSKSDVSGYDAFGVLVGTGELKSRGFGVAAKYELSKRTFAYTGLQTAKQDIDGAGDIKTTTFAVGVQHKF